MITNARALQDEWTPQEIVHRNAEKNQLRDALAPATHGNLAENVILTGPAGAGKTCLATYSLQRLEEQALDVDTAYVDCWANTGGRHKVLRDLLSAIGRAGPVHRGTPHDELLRHLQAHDQQVVAILDEVDQLADEALLRELYGIDQLAYILIGNDIDAILDPMDRRIRSRLRSGVHIRFDSYHADTLVEILRARADAALGPNAVSIDKLERIAEAAAGDAREAICILRQAARAADRDHAGHITDEHVEANIATARAELRQKSLDRLTDHQRVVYDILAASEGLAPKQVIERYQGRVSDPKSGRTVRSYLAKLEQYNLAEASGQGPAREYRALEPGS